MKRRVLRAHANKRCLRVLSASNQLRTPSTSDRAYAVLCDASFLRAVLLAYWQAHAPASWREARKRQLRKAAAATAQRQGEASSPSTPDGNDGEDTQREPQADTEKKRSASEGATRKTARSFSPASTATAIARLPVQLPALTAFEFLNALMQEAFHSSSASTGPFTDEDRERSGHPSSRPPSSNGRGASFLYHCLPETVAALHRMRESSPPSVASGAAHNDEDGASARREVHRASSSTGSAAVTRGRHHPQQQQHQHPSGSALEGLPAHQVEATERWLAATLGSLAARGTNHIPSDASVHGRPNSGGASSSSSSSAAVCPLTYQEVPALVVNALLHRLHLLQDPQVGTAAAAISLAPADASRDGGARREKNARADLQLRSSTQRALSGQQQQQPPPPPQQQYRNEAKAITDFMSFNQACLVHGGVVSTQDSLGFGHVRLCAMPRFTDVAVSSIGHHALKRQRKKQRSQPEADQPERITSNTNGGHGSCASDAAVELPSKPYFPRSFFIATQSHDVRRRLPPATALLRLTTNPDAIWIEQRGAAYHYSESGDDDAKSAGRGAANRQKTDSNNNSSGGGGGAGGQRALSRDATTRLDHVGGRRAGRHRTTPTPSATPTVMAAAPQLSRADVAFMKHLGKATHVPLPEKATSLASTAAAAAAAAPTELSMPEKAEGGAAKSGARKRPHQKGQNPLSMKKKQKREVFRA